MVTFQMLMCLLVQKPVSLFGQIVHLQSWHLQRECWKYWIQTSWHLCWHQNHLHVSPKLSTVFGDAKSRSAPGRHFRGFAWRYAKSWSCCWTCRSTEAKARSRRRACAKVEARTLYTAEAGVRRDGPSVNKRLDLQKQSSAHGMTALLPAHLKMACQTRMPYVFASQLLDAALGSRVACNQLIKQEGLTVTQAFL